jgi:hypothetical protein
MINENNCTRTTVGIKLRALRAVFNEADENGIINKRNCYPFGRRKYQIPTSRNVKKALELSDIQKIYDYTLDDLKERQARAYWLFCYFGNGMNPKDMAYLKYKNIDGEFLSFIRAKTERATRSNPKLKPGICYITTKISDIVWIRLIRKPVNNGVMFYIMVARFDLTKIL